MGSISTENLETASGAVQVVAGVIGKKLGRGFGEAYATFLTGQSAWVASIVDLASKTQNGTATWEEYADVGLNTADLLISAGLLVGKGTPQAFTVTLLLTVGLSLWKNQGIISDITLKALDEISDLVPEDFSGSQKWIERRDPLTLDLDGDGVIDNGSELFGDSTPLKAGGKAADGFAALVDQDSNKDGKVNSLDANFNNLKIWRDLNQDGISQAAELSTLSQLGINGLNTGKTANSQILADGNEIADLGTYTKTDGTVATLGEVSHMADVNLASDTFHREFPDQIPLAAGVANLPDMQGSGKVRNQRQSINIAYVKLAA